MFWIGKTRIVTFSIQAGISGSPVRACYYRCCFGCDKSRAPTIRRNCLGFCNLWDGIFCFHLKNECGLARNDIVIRFILVTSNLSPSITSIVWIQCDSYCLHVFKYSSHSLVYQARPSLTLPYFSGGERGSSLIDYFLKGMHLRFSIIDVDGVWLNNSVLEKWFILMGWAWMSSMRDVGTK